MIEFTDFDRKMMTLALSEARKANQMGEVPVGAVVAHPENGVISQAHNMRESSHRATAHAEVLAIEMACQSLKSWRLSGYHLYSTLEPCLMCSGALINSRMDCIYFAARDSKGGAVQSLYECLKDPRLNHHVTVFEGLFADESSQLLKSFFQQRRNQ